MSDNINIKDALGVSTTMRTTDTAGVHTPHHTVDASALPTGAATEAKQPALGAAGIASADVITVQGAAGMTPLDVTLPSIPAGSATIGNVGIIGTAAVTQSGGWTVAVSGSVAVTGPLTDAQLRAAAVPVSGTFFQATQPVSIATMPSTPVTGTFFQATQPVSMASAPTTPVTGTFWQVTQPVSGPLTDAQLRAAAVPVSGTFFQATQPVSAASLPLPAGASTEATSAAMSAKLPATLGQKASAASMSVVVASDQSTIPVSVAAASALFKGRACSFRTPGRAGTAGQKLFSIHNATASPVVVSVRKILVDLVCTAIKAVTVLPPVVRIWKVTVLPTNGTAATKNKIGGTTTSNAAVTTLGNASADGTSSPSALTATLPTGTFIEQQFATRLITAAGYEMADSLEFNFVDNPIVLNALEGLVVFLDYTLATQNPTTDMWTASVEWTEA